MAGALSVRPELAGTAARLGKDTLIVFSADHSFDTRLRGGRKDEPLPMVSVATTALVEQSMTDTVLSIALAQ